MRPLRGNGTSKPLGEWTLAEIQALAALTPVDEYGNSWIGMLRNEMRHFNSVLVADLAWQPVVTYGMALGLFDSDQEALAYVRSMLEIDRGLGEVIPA